MRTGHIPMYNLAALDRSGGVSVLEGSAILTEPNCRYGRWVGNGWIQHKITEDCLELKYNMSLNLLGKKGFEYCFPTRLVGSKFGTKVLTNICLTYLSP